MQAFKEMRGLEIDATDFPNLMFCLLLFVIAASGSRLEYNEGDRRK